MNNVLPLDHFDLSPDEVRGRYRTARRQGNPLWLWPETTFEGWQAAVIQIEHVARLILTGGGGRASLEGSAEDIGIAAFTSGMGPLLGYWVGRGILDAEPAIRSVLQLHYDHNCRRMNRLARHASEAVDALSDAGISVTVLKGMHTAYSHFPEPGTRPVSDIDLLIDASDKQRAGKVLGTLGYLPGPTDPREQSWRMSGSPTEPRCLSLTHHDNPWNIDLHTSLDKRCSPGSPRIALDRALGKQAREPWHVAPAGHTLPPNQLALHLAVHASTSFVSLTMIRLIELVLVIESTKGNRRSFWDSFLALSEQTGNPSVTYPALHFANMIANDAIPEAVLRRLERRITPAVRRVVGRLTPATCQSMRHYSLEERFMWTTTFRGWLQEVVRHVLPEAGPREILGIQARRFWILARGTITR